MTRRRQQKSFCYDHCDVNPCASLHGGKEERKGREKGCVMAVRGDGRPCQSYKNLAHTVQYYRLFLGSRQ